MVKLVALAPEEAKRFFLKGSSYFNADFPNYISFEPILQNVQQVLGEANFNGFSKIKPEKLPDVNYSFIANKDGRFAWRPLELMHPVIYVSLVNKICTPENWIAITNRYAEFDQGVVTCCSSPVVADDKEKDQAAQIREWWLAVEQTSLALSLQYSHVLHTDVTDCYGSIYTHSISWALHGLEVTKKRGAQSAFGDSIDHCIRAGRWGQTNGISQGSVLMDFLAEIVLGYVDELITKEVGGQNDFRILRYRDDYRIFTNSDKRAESLLKIISDCLRQVGMRLGVSKTYTSTNVIEGSIKIDKMAAMELQDIGDANAKTLQKQLLRLHSFGRKYPNSGALKRLLGEFHKKIAMQKIEPDDIEVQVAIATDIAVTSPVTFPVIAGILTHLLALRTAESKAELWAKIREKMRSVPYNGYQEVWLQRVTKSPAVPLDFSSDEIICKIVDGLSCQLWNNTWISSEDLKAAMDTRKIVVSDTNKVSETIDPPEVALFNENAFAFSG